MKKKTILTQKRAHELLDYDPEIGDIRWACKISRKFDMGQIAGTINTCGYIRIAIFGKLYLAHRLAWLYVYGYLPENDLDHIDRDKTNNRIKNLREVSRQCNNRNRNISKNNKSEVTGVCFHNNSSKHVAQIGVAGTILNLGYFKQKIDAVKARWKGEIKYNFPNCNTTSTAYLYLKKRGLI